MTIIISKTGNGRPAPGELEPGEIGINISTLEFKYENHYLWDENLLETARAYTADEDGLIKAIGDWDSMSITFFDGDIPYASHYTGGMDGKVHHTYGHMKKHAQGFMAQQALDPDYRDSFMPMNGDDPDLDTFASNYPMLRQFIFEPKYEADSSTIQDNGHGSVTLEACGANGARIPASISRQPRTRS